MAKLNHNYKNLKQSFLFSEMAKRTNDFIQNNPDTPVIRLGIGDVTRPLSNVVIEAIKKAADEQLVSETFAGYGPEQGYPFLREAISNYYKSFGVNVNSSDVFVADGAKSDVANITDIFSLDSKVLIANPVYPVYLDTNVMDGREIAYLDANSSNSFLPMPPSKGYDMIYLCSPNNPTGACYTRQQLTQWVDYANQNGAVILYDAAYEAFIEEDLPRSIFEIPGAKTCAIEFCSLSKTAGFTGMRCSYTVVPSELMLGGESVKQTWLRRQTTKFNGVSYIVQRGAEAVFSQEGLAQCKENINYYKENAKLIVAGLKEIGIDSVGGVNSPYVWFRCPENMGSWETFDLLLSKGVVITPGVGFGDQGEGYMRISSFGSKEAVVEGMGRIKELFGS